MHPAARPRRAAPLAAAVLAVAAAAPPRARAQDSAAGESLGGSARVALGATTARLDGGDYHTYAVSAATLPFVGEHVQVGVAPSYTAYKYRETPAGQLYGAGLTANYVFGSGARWRGYVGGYASTSGAVHGPSTQQAGAQVGALYFLDPALGVRAELRYRVPTSGVAAGRGTEVLVVTLDPYVFGRTGARTPGWAGLGAADVSAFLYYEVASELRQTGAAVALAPYLARWAQVGVEGEAVQGFEYSAYQARRVRGFGRLYVPLTRRTQPFAEAFAESSTYAGDDGGLTGYGWAFGARRLLNARVALDVGVRRTLTPTLTLGPAGHEFRVRFPGQTGLVAGLATRVGRVR